jgi:predicted small metal-binding protein
VIISPGRFFFFSLWWDGHTRGDNDAELVRCVGDHMWETHGETVIRENRIDNIKARITDESKAA